MIGAISFSLYLRSSNIIRKNRTIKEKKDRLRRLTYIIKYEELFANIIIHATLDYDSKVS